MTKKRSAPVPYVQPYLYPSPNVPQVAIRRFARRIAERFHPDKIILFGSYAYGTRHADSDGFNKGRAYVSEKQRNWPV